MFKYLFLLFTVVPALEIYLLIQIGGAIGALNTFLIIITTGVIGAFLAKSEGLLALKRITEQLENKKLPHASIIDGFMILIGGVLLITPGFFTDAFGLLLVLPTRRFLFAKAFQSILRQAMKGGNFKVYRSNKAPSSRQDTHDKQNVIPGEFTRKDE